MDLSDRSLGVEYLSIFYPYILPSIQGVLIDSSLWIPVVAIEVGMNTSGNKDNRDGNFVELTYPS